MSAPSERAGGSDGNTMNSGRSAPMPTMGVSTGGRRFLERRLAMILRERVPLRLPRAGLLAVALLALTALPAWSQRSGDEPIKNSQEGTAERSIDPPGEVHSYRGSTAAEQ